MARYVSVGDFLFDPSRLAFAFTEVDSEGLHLRLGFTGPGGPAAGEVRLDGIEARSMLRWLRSRAHFVDAGGPVATGRRARPGPGDSRPSPGHDGCRLHAVSGQSR